MTASVLVGSMLVTRPPGRRGEGAEGDVIFGPIIKRRKLLTNDGQRGDHSPAGILPEEAGRFYTVEKVPVRPQS